MPKWERPTEVFKSEIKEVLEITWESNESLQQQNIIPQTPKNNEGHCLANDSSP